MRPTFLSKFCTRLPRPTVEQKTKIEMYDKAMKKEAI